MLEVIATCAEDVLRIVEGGGKRIELVSALTEGGLTPSKGLIEFAVKHSESIPVMVMIRPHAMGFVYSQSDTEIMERDIEIAKECGVYGVVFGALTQNNRLDSDCLSRLLNHTSGLSVTFHRAIDVSANPIALFKELLNYPVDRVLTSGGHGIITNNLDKLAHMVALGKGRLDVLAGSGITLDNVSIVMENSGVEEVHVGTAVRKNKSALLPIEPDAIKNFMAKLQN